MAYEVNADGLVAPFHHYAGLSFGNVASMAHAREISAPREAALQGLVKMKMLWDMGLKQLVLPPHPRPMAALLRQHGFKGTVQEVLDEAFEKRKDLFSASWSASAMWAANAATISPSCDTIDGKVHITPANLSATIHRSLEAEFTTSLFKRIFNDSRYFVHHPPVPEEWSDEGAANHSRFAVEHGGKGLHLYAYGRSVYESMAMTPSRFPARQTSEAQLLTILNHGLPEEQIVFAQQHPDAIDAGIFHNDVAAVGNLMFFLCHEKAYLNQHKVLEEIRRKSRVLFSREPYIVVIRNSALPLEDAVETYFFNSQIVSVSKGRMVMIAPEECESHSGVQKVLSEIIGGETRLTDVVYVNVRQSMKNGGGPACLRLRIPLTKEEYDAVHDGVKFSRTLYKQLCHWVMTYYPETLTLGELVTPDFRRQCHEGLLALEDIIGLKGLYQY